MITIGKYLALAGRRDAERAVRAIDAASVAAAITAHAVLALRNARIRPAATLHAGESGVAEAAVARAAVAVSTVQAVALGNAAICSETHRQHKWPKLRAVESIHD